MYVVKARYNRKIFILFIALSLLFPGLAFLGIFLPEGEKLSVWFQRSGSLMVLFSVIAEYYALKMSDLFFPVEMQGEPLHIDKVRFTKQSKICAGLAVFVICLGTIVWGYGDLVIA